jgi:hypothetical protein
VSGAGYIKNDRVRIEFQYVLELSRNAATDALAYSDNSFRLDFKYSSIRCVTPASDPVPPRAVPG